jgi:hypothetical protein
VFKHQSVAFGGFDVFGAILGLLRVCSYWNMKKRFISRGTGSSAAHNDIDGPEVAHAIWQAAFASAL